MRAKEELKELPLIKDPIHGSVVLTKLEKEVISHYLFNRLHSIRQQSLVYRVFPGATHSRFIHSIGVMHVASEMFRYGLANALPEDAKSLLRSNFLRRDGVNSSFEVALNKFCKDESCLSRLCESINGLSESSDQGCNYRAALESIKDISGREDFMGVLKTVMNSCVLGENFVLTHIPSNTSLLEEVSYSLLLQVVRLRALLHDVGHLPFSHTTENAFARFAAEQEIQKLSADFRKIHEILSDRVIPLILEQSFQQLQSMCLPFYGEENAISGYIYQLIAEVVTYMVSNMPELMPGIYYTLISTPGGLLDADRLDYIIRDGVASGLFNSVADYKRVIVNQVLIRIDNHALENMEIKTLSIISFSLFRKPLSRYLDGDDLWKSIAGMVQGKLKMEGLNKIREKLLEAWKGLLGELGGSLYLIIPEDRVFGDSVQLLTDRFKIFRHVNSHHRVRRLDGVLEDAILYLLNFGKESKNRRDADKRAGKSKSKRGKRETSSTAKCPLNETERISIQLYDAFIELTTGGPFSEEGLKKLEQIKSFFEFTDEWLVVNLSAIYNELRRQGQLLGNLQRCGKRDFLFLRNLLAEFFQRKSFFSLWKREADFWNYLCSEPAKKALASFYSEIGWGLPEQRDEEESCDQIRCLLQIAFKRAAAENPQWRNKLQEHLRQKGLDSVTIAQVSISHAADKLHPLLLVMSSRSPAQLRRTIAPAYTFSSLLCSLAEEVKFTPPIFIYPRRDTGQRREELAPVAIEAMLEFVIKNVDRDRIEQFLAECRVVSGGIGGH